MEFCHLKNPTSISPKMFTQVDRTVVAIYWADGDIRQSGTISYRMVESIEDQVYIQELLTSAFDFRKFDPNLIFVVTYADIPQTRPTPNNLSVSSMKSI